MECLAELASWDIIRKGSILARTAVSRHDKNGFKMKIKATMYSVVSLQRGIPAVYQFLSRSTNTNTLILGQNESKESNHITILIRKSSTTTAILVRMALSEPIPRLKGVSIETVENCCMVNGSLEP